MINTISSLFLIYHQFMVFNQENPWIRVRIMSYLSSVRPDCRRDHVADTLLVADSGCQVPWGPRADGSQIRWQPFGSWDISMGISGSKNGDTLVPYFWPYFVGIFPYIGLIGSWNGHWIFHYPKTLANWMIVPNSWWCQPGKKLQRSVVSWAVAWTIQCVDESLLMDWWAPPMGIYSNVRSWHMLVIVCCVSGQWQQSEKD